jgi:hypothetical protein
MNNKAQFTPGPWVVECDKFIATPDAIVITELNDGLRGECPKSGHFNANAALIAAAPAMYEALSELVKYLREEVADEALDTWAPVFKAAMALAQAEGR